jgi:hypothetical protein
MEAKMSARTGKLVLAASLALAPGLLLAQDRAVPRGGGDGGGGSRGGSSDAGAHHPGPSTSSAGSSSSGSSYSPSGSGYSGGGSSTAERRHPRAGTGTGSSGYYPGYGYPGYPGYYPGWGGYYPGYWGYWWPYGSYGWYGGYGAYGFGGYGYPGGTVYYSRSGDTEAGSVRVLVDPSEARVYVDGYYAGVVDDFDGLFQRLHVSSGRHDISLKLEGYTTHRMRVYVGPDATVKLHYDLQKGSGETFEDLSNGAPPPPEREVRREREDDAESAPAEPPADEHQGQLRLRVDPADASIYVDGAFRGTAREAGSLRLPPGRHRIEVVRPGYRTSDQEIEVAPGETTQLSVTLERTSI